MQDNYPCICKCAQKQRFCRELENTRPTKELKAFFAFTESQPTSATLHYQQTNQHGSMEGRPLHLKEEEDHGYLRRFSWRLQFGHKKTLSGLRSGWDAVATQSATQDPRLLLPGASLNFLSALTALTLGLFPFPPSLVKTPIVLEPIRLSRLEARQLFICL